MAFSRLGHICVARHGVLNCPLLTHRKNRAQTSQRRCLSFFAAERPAHSPALNRHSIHRPAEHIGNQTLHVTWVLRRN